MAFVRFMGFSVVRAWQGFWRNAMMSLAATATVVLMLVLLAALVHRDQRPQLGAGLHREQGAVTARLDRRARRTTEREELTAEIREHAGRRRARNTSPRRWRCSACATPTEQRGQELETGGAPITAFASLEISLATRTPPERWSTALSDQRATIERITHQAGRVRRPCSGSSTSSARWGSWPSGLVALTVLFMIINTIRIAVYSAAPTRSRSCAWSARRTASSAGRSSSRGSCAGSIGALITIVLVAAVWDPIQPAMVNLFQMPTAVSTRFLATISAPAAGGRARGRRPRLVDQRPLLSVSATR